MMTFTMYLQHIIQTIIHFTKIPFANIHFKITLVPPPPPEIEWWPPLLALAGCKLYTDALLGKPI